ncbi:MAG TPA: hypothetical protein VFZ53_00860 [Polyangiaceae bacterium]
MPLSRSISAVVLVALSVAAAPGCMAGGAAPSEESGLYGDCLGADSPTDMACTEDCVRDCGFTHPMYERAKKYCVCQAGVYIECRCPRPDWYKGAPDAPYCDKYTEDGSGKTMLVDKRPCDAEWDQCVARDIVDGFTPRGCVCTRDPEPLPNGRLVWECGSTEKWFYPDQSVIE